MSLACHFGGIEKILLRKKDINVLAIPFNIIEVDLAVFSGTYSFPIMKYFYLAEKRSSS